MKRIFLVLFCMLALPVLASHIVGGEFELIHLTGNQYRLNLILYFDEANGNPRAQDETVLARIFRKRDNRRMMDVTLLLTEEDPVTYTQQNCAIGELRTKRLTYTSLVTLSSQSFNDPEGYYVVWERCCRNYQITNIFSQDPNVSRNYAGQTFYLEFPAVTKDGQPFVNSSPRLFPPLSDYACPRKPYYVDFAGIDDDGDSLVYTLVTPLNTRSGDAIPLSGPRPRPYPDVTYRPGFSLSHSVGGDPDLWITTDGFLRVTPMQQGLFVFAVKCEEFRDGVKIGEVRRDFQMLVLDACPAAEPPLIVGKKLTDTDYKSGNLTLSFSNTVWDQDRCIEVRVSDPDASKADDNFTENIHIRAIPIGFKGDMTGILPKEKTATLKNGSTQTFNICFDQCPPNESGIFQVAIIAYDDACALPLSDTLRLTVYVEPPLNRPPQFTSLPVNDLVNEDDQRSYPVTAIDPDGDPLTIGIFTDEFAMPNVGMTVNVLDQSPGHYDASLDWDTRCRVYDFTHKTSFDIHFIAEDDDLCHFSHRDTVRLQLAVKLPGNADPVISTDLSPEEVTNGVTRKVFESLDFNVFGKDTVDNDYLQLAGAGIVFPLSNYEVMIPAMSANSRVNTHFSWKLDCDNVNLREKQDFLFRFIVVDAANKCKFYKADTLNVKVKVLPPDNLPPDFVISNTNPDLAFQNNTQSITLGQQISLGLFALDSDTNPNDRVRIELISAEGNVQPEGYVFADAEGIGSAQTTFSWLPDCSIFRDGVYENNYTFRFRALDDRCFNVKGDTIDVHFNIKDINSKEADFIPPNFVSANGDSYNDFFAMVRENRETGDLESILPLDNCVGRFLSMAIYNRWGTEIFVSTDRNFRWRPLNQGTGVYFYTLKYSNKEYKGTITLRD